MPKEMVYYKPQKSPESFLAQEPIYKGIEQKPVLRDNPQLSHETSVAIGSTYNAIQSGTLTPEQQTAAEQTLGLFTKDNMKSLGLDINNFEASRDISKMRESLASRPQEFNVSNLDLSLKALENMEIVSNAVAQNRESFTAQSYQELSQKMLSSDLKPLENSAADKSPTLNEEAIKAVSDTVKSVVGNIKLSRTGSDSSISTAASNTTSISASSEKSTKSSRFGNMLSAVGIKQKQPPQTLWTKGNQGGVATR
jgi:hypothetical protein